MVAGDAFLVDKLSPFSSSFSHQYMDQRPGMQLRKSNSPSGPLFPYLFKRGFLVDKQT